MYMYNIYQDGEKVGETKEKNFTVTDLEPDTEYSFSVSETVGNIESEKSEVIKVRTDVPLPNNITITPKTTTLDVGGTRKLTSKIEPSNAYDKTYWTTDNKEVATVTDEGLIEAKTSGKAVITATAAYNQSVSAVCNVVVNEIEVPEEV